LAFVVERARPRVDRGSRAFVRTVPPGSIGKTYWGREQRCKSLLRRREFTDVSFIEVQLVYEAIEVTLGSNRVAITLWVRSYGIGEYQARDGKGVE